MNHPKPKVFVASSVEGLSVAYSLQTNLNHDADLTVWSQGVFALSETPLDSIVKSLHSSDYGIFVFSPDDEIKMRGNVTDTVRDNVLFELGLFIGRLGKTRCFIVTPDNIDLHIPTDLLGVTPATYSGARDESELEATLGPVSHEIRKAMKVQGLFKSQSKSEQKIPTSSNDNYDEDDKLILLESWLENEAVPGVAIKYSDVDDLLKIDNGSTKKLLSYLFKPNGLYRLSSSGANVFKFYVENIYSL